MGRKEGSFAGRSDQWRAGYVVYGRGFTGPLAPFVPHHRHFRASLSPSLQVWAEPTRNTAGGGAALALGEGAIRLRQRGGVRPCVHDLAAVMGSARKAAQPFAHSAWQKDRHKQKTRIKGEGMAQASQ